MSLLKKIIYNLPEVAGPTQRRLSFKQKLKWTLLIIVLYFVLGAIPVFGVMGEKLQYLEELSILFGASFGSIISLGIGPIVTASIVLQLLNGSGLWKFDLSNPEGKKMFQGIQKLMTYAFIIVESVIYVKMGGLTPSSDIPGAFGIVVFQLILGGILIMFMDEICQKWGFGSGVSLFIAAGVSKVVFLGLFNPFNADHQFALNQSLANPIGKVWAFILNLNKSFVESISAFASVIATVGVFAIAVYMQAMKVEIPLSFGRIRGHGVRWPLNFLYTSNIPVILIAALIANIRLIGSLLNNGQAPTSGFFFFIQNVNVVELGIRGGISSANIGMMIAQVIIYMLIFMLGSMVFSIFWVQSAGMDARSQARQMMSSGLQIPGFRKDERILERILKRYITPLTIMGGLSIGFLAAIADMTGAIGSGTGILLTVMILYRLYEDIAQQHMMDMNPMMRKFMGGE